ncbi:MAG: bifunctional diguanylate cyclase/phosphodiesterase [Cellvibrionaceae bacterium]
MSLFKQLWLAIFIIIVICLVGSFALTTLSAKTYLETHLYQKNVDSANSLALNLGNNDFSPITAELKISSQFDSGHYSLIRLTDVNKNIIIEKIESKPISKIPAWFVTLININPPAATSKVSNGWRQLGEIEVASSSQFAYHQLWRNSILLFIYFTITGIISGLIGHFILTKVTEPLQDVIKQAEAIGNRKFITIDQPKTLDFKKLVVSMNKLSKQVQIMLAETAERLHASHREKSKDEETQLLTRDALLDQIHAYLRRDDHTASGAIALIQLPDLPNLSKILGREKLEKLVNIISHHLKNFSETHTHSCVGRLSTSNFIIVLPDTSDHQSIINQLAKKIREKINEHHYANDVFLTSSSNYSPREDFEVILNRLTTAIEDLQINQNIVNDDNEIIESRLIKHIHHKENNLPNQIDDWSKIFKTAFHDKKFQLNLFPVIDKSLHLLHLEAPIRLQFEDSLLNAGQFLGWAKRSDNMTHIDVVGLTLAFEWLEKQSNDIGINISPELLADAKQQKTFIEILSKHKHLANRLWIEIPENGVYHFLSEFKMFAEQLKLLGCHIGIEHGGHAIEKIGLLHDIGLDYLKVDSAFIRSIDNNHANQIFLLGLVTIAHSLGLKIIAEGVQNKKEEKQLWDLGFDGQTGPAVGIPN